MRLLMRWRRSGRCAFWWWVGGLWSQVRLVPPVSVTCNRRRLEQVRWLFGGVEVDGGYVDEKGVCWRSVELMKVQLPVCCRWCWMAQDRGVEDVVGVRVMTAELIGNTIQE